MSKKLDDALRDQKQQTEQYNQKISGMLGIPINGARAVEVAGRNSYVYVRLRSSQNEVIQAFNNRVAPSYNLPVLVERQGNRYVVLDVDTKRYDNNWGSYSPYLPRHGNTHSFDIESGGGGDVVWVYPRQFMPLLAFPSGSVGSPNVIVSPYTLKKENGTWMYVGNTGTASFTPYNPTSSGSVMGLIVLNTDTGNPYLLINSGSVFFGITGSSQIYPYIPTLTNPLHIPIAAVRLVSGTSRLTWDNIYDVRQFVHGHASGSAGGGLSSIAVQDEGTPQGNVTTFDFIGVPVTVTVSGSVAQVTVTATASGSSGGSPAFTGTGNSGVLTSPSGTLYTPPWYKWGVATNPFLELGSDVANKETNAGRWGYNMLGDGYFDMIGAGTGSSTRRFKMYDHLIVQDSIESQTMNITSPSATYNITGSPHVHQGTISPSYIDGLKISYVTSGSISVSPGSAYVRSLGRMVEATGSIIASIPINATNVSGSWLNVYMYESGGAAALEIIDTAPSDPYAGVARTKTGNDAMRYLGSLYCDAGGYLYRFNSNVQGNMWRANWLEVVNAFPFQFANVSGTVSTPTAINIPWLVPPTLGLITEMQIQTVHNLVAAGDNVVSITDDTGITIPAASNVNAESVTRMTNGSAAATNIQIAASPLKLSGNRFLYTHANLVGTNGAFFRSRGYHIQR